MWDHFIGNTAWPLMEGGLPLLFPITGHVSTVYVGLLIMRLLGSWYEKPVL